MSGDTPAYTMSRGTTRTFTQSVDKAGLGISGVTGMVFTFMAKRHRSDPDNQAIITKHDSDFTRVIVGDSTTDALLEFSILPTDTANLGDYTTLQIEVRVQDLAGKTAQLARGVLAITDEIVGTIS